MPEVAELPHVADFGDMIDPARTALIVVDIQVDFAAKHGVLGRIGLDMSSCETAIDRIEDLISAARTAGATVGFMRVVTRPETDSVALLTWMQRRGTAGSESICRAEGGGADYYRVAPEPGDIEIQKLKYSSFHGTDLDAQLRARGVDTLVVAGISTDCCVDSTARDAFHHDYNVFVVSDACATFEESLHSGTLHALNEHCALLATTDAVVGAWSR